MLATETQLGSLMARRQAAVNPASYPDEIFDLFSIPAFDKSEPDILPGSEIGSSKKAVEPGDVLLSRIVPHIRRAWVVPKGDGRRQIASSEWIVFRSKEFFPPYLRHYLTSDQFHSKFMNTVAGVGGSLLRARPEQVAEFSITLPSLAEQKRIAAILDKADAIRRKRIDACELARESVRNFFLSQFGDPILNVKGFDSCPIAEVAKIVTGNTPSRDDPENYGDGIEWIKSDNINTPSHYLTQSSERLSEIGERKSRPVPAGSTLVTCIAGSPSCIGNAALADRRVACNQQINAVVPGERLIDRFLYAMILVLKPAIQQLSSKSMKGMVSKGRFETLPVIVPPLAEQKKFAAVFDQIVGMTAKMENAAEESGALFNSLVQRAFKGEL